MSAAEELRAAGTKLRTLAQAATPGPWDSSGWVYGTEATESYGVWAGAINTRTPRPPIAKTSRLDQGNANAMFIAAMHPTVAFVVADWLDHTASLIEGNAGRFEGTQSSGMALLTARAINGPTP